VHADKTGTPKFRGSGCQFPQSQCHPSPRTGISLGTRLDYAWLNPCGPIPPPGNTPGICIFLQECSKFPTPGTLKLDNSPLRGIAYWSLIAYHLYCWKKDKLPTFKNRFQLL
jgi:hypothetical protein